MSINVKEPEDKTNRGASLLAFPEPPCLQKFPEPASARSRRRFQSVFRRPVRFGEALFTEARRKPQEEKRTSNTFFSGAQVLLGEMPVDKAPPLRTPCVSAPFYAQIRAEIPTRSRFST